MKEYIKLAIYALIFTILIIISIKLYNKLTQEYVSSESQQGQIQGELKKATDFTVINMNEEKARLSDNMGKPVVVNFWATWCGPCKMELPYFDELSEKYAGQVEFMMVNLTDGYQEKIEDVKVFISENKYEFPVFFDTEFSVQTSYNLYSIPQTIFVDEKGNLINSHIGAMSKATLENYIKQLIETKNKTTD